MKYIFMHHIIDGTMHYKSVCETENHEEANHWLGCGGYDYSTARANYYELIGIIPHITPTNTNGEEPF